MAQRESFLARIRNAADRGRPYRVQGPSVADEIGYLGVGGDLCEHFAAEVNAVGGQAFLAANWDAARERLRQLLIESAAALALSWQHELLTRLGLADVLHTLGIERVDFAVQTEMNDAERRPKQLACDVGITSCDCAIAETGTLMMCSRPGQERIASLLPPVHIAIIERPQIVPDLIDGFRLLAERGLSALPSNVTFITGPSKTGDIELQLTTGVHGPGQWRVIVVTA